MFITRITVACDKCNNLLPGVGEDWFSCHFFTVDTAMRQARSKGWLVWEQFDENGSLVPTGEAICTACKGK